MLDQTANNGGTFSYDVLAEEAAFDVFVGTRAIPVIEDFAKLIRGGAFAFPFDLEASIPLPLVDALGLVTGTGSLEVTQTLDEYYTVPVMYDPDNPFSGLEPEPPREGRRHPRLDRYLPRHGEDDRVPRHAR